MRIYVSTDLRTSRLGPISQSSTTSQQCHLKDQTFNHNSPLRDTATPKPYHTPSVKCHWTHELGKRGTSSSFYQEPTPIARNPLLGDSINPFERAEPSWPKHLSTLLCLGLSLQHMSLGGNIQIIATPFCKNPTPLKSLAQFLSLTAAVHSWALNLTWGCS
jgi:hypothetical protein